VELQSLLSDSSTGAAQTAQDAFNDDSGNKTYAMNYYNGYINQLKKILLRSGLTKARIDDLMKDVRADHADPEGEPLGRRLRARCVRCSPRRSDRLRRGHPVRLGGAVNRR
jgi:hypothetical protein